MTDISLDTETGLIIPGVLAPPLVCATFAQDGEADIEHVHGEMHALLEELLDRRDGALWLLNGAYDMGVIATEYPDLMPSIFDAYDAGRILDVGINAMLLDLAAGCFEGYRVVDGETVKYGYSLKELAERFGGMVLSKGEDTWRLRYIELRDVPLERWPAEAKSYALDDARATLAIAQAVGRTPDDAAQARYAWALHLLSLHGIRTSAAHIDRLEADAKAELGRIEEVLVAAGLVRADGSRDTKAAKARMIEVMDGHYNCKTTEKGAVSLDKDACAESGDKLLGFYAERMGIVDKINTKVPKLRQGCGDWPIQGRLSVLSETGRVRCSEGKIGNGYQLTNVEKHGGIRECFVPRKNASWTPEEIHRLRVNFGLEIDTAKDGYVFCDIDFPGLELRTVAQVCLSLLGESRLAEMLNAGVDPHLDMAAQLLGITYEEAQARREAGDEEAEKARDLSKAANFGFPGGLGAARFCEWARSQYKIRIAEHEAKELKAVWLATKPEFRAYFEMVGQLTSTGSGTGEALYVGRQRAGASFTELCNFFFQALGSDIAKSALYDVQRACWADVDSVLYGARPVNFVHDEILAEVREDIAHEQATEMGRLMREAANRFLPDVPMPEMKPALSRCWSKDAKSLRDAGGRLIVWEG